MVLLAQDMQTLAGAVDALHRHWEVPGKPMAIDLSRDVTGAILLEAGRGLIPRRRAEVGGILLGVVEAGETVTVRVEACVELPCEHLFGPSYALSEIEKETLRHVLAQYAPGAGSELYAVGFYRTHTRRGLRLDSDDLLLADFFPDRADLALLVKPRYLRRSRAALLFWEAPDSPAIQFSIGKHDKLDQPASPEPEPESDPEPEPADETAGRPRPRSWWCSLWIQTPLFACLLFAWGLLGFFAGRQVDKVIPRAPAPPRDPYALSLMVLQYQDNMHLTWDRQARPIAVAERGALTIADAGESRTLDLTAAQLRTASVTYHRLSQHVLFRLEVFLPGHRSVSETWEASPQAQGQ
jgi:hypothetical protein